MIDRKIFFDATRRPLFFGLSQRQTLGTEAILDEWERRGWSDLRWLAYMLATTLHETDKTMQPIEEYGQGKGKKYGKPEGPYGKIYYGRGFVQLTWLENYTKAKGKIGVDFVKNPELALETGNAAKIMFDGMKEGWFTGKKLSDFFNQSTTNWTGARQIINRMDKASVIAGYARQFHEALLAASKDYRPVLAAEPTATPKSALQSKTVIAAGTVVLAEGSNIAGQVTTAVDQINQIKQATSGISDLFAKLATNPAIWISIVVIGLGIFIYLQRIKKLNENGV